MIGPLELLLAFLLDAAMGDPRWLPHPVRAMGRAITALEGVLRRRIRDKKRAGALLVLIITSASYLLALGLAWVLRLFPPGPWEVLAHALMVWLASTTIALRGLLTGVRGVLRSGGLDEARRRVARLVGRETGGLDQGGVRRAALESLSENTSDGVVAPLFYLALGGLPLAVAYKAVNTLDSMVGYRSEEYVEFGRAAARLDDAVNYIPARLTGLLMAASAFVLSGRGGAVRAFRVMMRDGRKHPSPNSGIPEAAMAGALGMRFGGPSAYGGVVVERPYIGDGPDAPSEEVSGRALWITALASVMALMLAALTLFLRAG